MKISQIYHEISSTPLCIATMLSIFHFRVIFQSNLYQSINQFISGLSTKQRICSPSDKVRQKKIKKEKINNNEKRDHNQQTQT